MGDIGENEPISVSEYRFTIRDAEILSGVSQVNIRNWINRGVLPIGKRHFTRSWMLTLLDVLQVRVMHQLVVKLSLKPTDAGKVAAFAARIAWDSTQRDADGKLINSNTNILIAADDDGQWIVGTASTTHPAYRPPPAYSTEAIMRGPHIVIPVTAMFRDIFLKTADLQTEHAT